MVGRKLLLVAGPSGCGKSLFIDMLRANAIDPAIITALPADCTSWPVVEANNMMKNGQSASDLMPRDGLAILHYDITFIHRFALTNYTRDPFCAALTGAEQIEIIYIKPNKDRLIQQFRQRRHAHRKTKRRANLLWADWFRMPLKRSRLKRQGLPAREVHELYDVPGFLDNCYACWEGYLRQLSTAVSNCRGVIVEPTNGPNGEPSFVVKGRF